MHATELVELTESSGTYVVEVFRLDPATQLNFALTKTVLVSSRDESYRGDRTEEVDSPDTTTSVGGEGG